MLFCKIKKNVGTNGCSENDLLHDSVMGMKCIAMELGDAVIGAATVILAMGAGKKAAKGIDEYLSR